MIGVALAVGIGVQLGQSAVAGINPIHFQGAAPRAEGIDPATLAPPAQSAYAQAYGWEQGDAARLAEAGAYQDFNYVPQATVRPAMAPIWQEETVPANLTPWPPGRVTSHPEVERYTEYPIEDKVIDQPVAEPPAADQPKARPDASLLAATGQ